MGLNANVFVWVRMSTSDREEIPRHVGISTSRITRGCSAGPSCAAPPVRPRYRGLSLFEVAARLEKIRGSADPVLASMWAVMLAAC